MPNRITGMYSGLDTESLIKDLVKAKSSNVEKLKKEKTKREWKEEQWSALNTKIKSFFSKSVSSMRYQSNYSTKKTSVSNSSAVSVITGAGAMNSVQSLSIKQLAATGYLTGSKIEMDDGSKITEDSLIKDIKGVTVSEGTFTVTVAGEATDINITAETTISSLVSQLNKAGVNANFDLTNQRLFIGAKASGKDNDFDITGDDDGRSLMKSLGIESQLTDSTRVIYETKISLANKAKATTPEAIANDTTSELYKLFDESGIDMTDPDDVQNAYNELIRMGKEAQTALEEANEKGPVKLQGQDAVIELNGAKFTSASNNIEVNGITFTCLDVAENITVTTVDDTEGIYSKVKGFLKEYNELINEINKLYDTRNTKGYDVLSDDEKDAMTEKEIEKWENTIKDSMLHNDDTLSGIYNGLREVMSSGIEINGKTLYLSNFGINTASYFEAGENEKYAYHIDGDEDDSLSNGKEDTLKTMIANDSETVITFFSSLINDLYQKMNDLSASSDYSSFGSFYDDKKYKTDMSDIEKKISEAEEKLAAYEDKWYSKFSAMETALSKMDSSNSYLSSLFS